MGSRRPTSARCASLLLYCHGMKLLSVSSWNSTTGSLELGKKDFHAKYIVKEQLGKGGFGVVYSAERRPSPTPCRGWCPPTRGCSSPASRSVTPPPPPPPPPLPRL